jgi:hypothetical protein
MRRGGGLLICLLHRLLKGGGCSNVSEALTGEKVFSPTPSFLPSTEPFVRNERKKHNNT